MTLRHRLPRGRLGWGERRNDGRNLTATLRRGSGRWGCKRRKLEIHCEGPSAATPQPKESEYLPQRRKGRKEKETIFVRTWRSSRLGGRNIRIRDVSCIGKFAPAAKTLKHSRTKITKFKITTVRNLRVLRAVRGERAFGHTIPMLGTAAEKFTRAEARTEDVGVARNVFPA